MSEAKDDSLESRVKKPKLPLTVRRRLKASENLPPGLMRSVIEACATPVIIYERLREKSHNVAYANPAAINACECSFEEFMNFKTATLDIGDEKEAQLDKILISCAREGWNELNGMVMKIHTEDKKILRMSPYFLHQKEYGRDYWIAIVDKDNIHKINPKSWSFKTFSFFEKIHRAFRRDRIFMQAPEYVNKAFVDDAAKKVSREYNREYNLVIDFNKTQSVGEGVLKVLKEMSSTFHDQLFLVNTADPLYQLLTHHRVSKENIYRAKKPPISISFA